MEKYLLNENKLTTTYFEEGKEIWVDECKSEEEFRQTYEHLLFRKANVEYISKDIEIKKYFNKREWDKFTKYKDIEEITAQVWADSEGLYLEVFANGENMDYETIIYSNTLIDTELNRKAMFKALKKEVNKIASWFNIDINLEKEIISV